MMGEFDPTPSAPNVQAVTIRDDGLAEWKQYRRGGRLFWRKYGRPVPGGITFVQRIGEMHAITRQFILRRLSEDLFGEEKWPPTS